MTMLAFNKATDPKYPEDLHIVSSAVRFVEVSRMDTVDLAIIHVLGKSDAGIQVSDALDVVVSSIGGLITATRHYLAGQPPDGGSKVFISPANVSYIRPSTPDKREFWYINFTDDSELRIVDPLPTGL